ncbi:MAG: hypothetical protein IBX50_13910 [Marinospirillum sp.]|uniref:hypothetical protein n=1 Tax=Marinospirillum sp. TaxID=2183934 RepID=UPI001A0C968B|nr:hypothetical protein [Marinospirillum sp.]MBE0507782.1 hypothetical protein [Marinospirillum sp.]
MALLTDKQFIAVGLAGVLFVWWTSRKVGQVANAVNPLNPENVINQAAEGAFTAVTGIEQPPGVALYGWRNGERDEWTMGRTDEIIWERQARGEPLEPMTAIAQARHEWNTTKAGWFNRWSKKELMGYGQ